MQTAGTYNSQKNEWLHQERIRLSYSHFREAFWGQAAAVLFIGGILWPVVSHLRIVIWFCIDMLRRFFFFLLWRSYKKNSPVTARTSWYEKGFIAIVVAGGTIHGSSALFLFPINSVPHQAMMAFIIGGIVSGVVGLHSVNMKAVIAYVLPAMLPFAVRFMVVGDRIHIIMGVTLFTYIVVMLSVARRMHAITLEALSLSYELCLANDTLEEEVHRATVSLRESLAEEKRLREEKEMTLRELHDGVGSNFANAIMLAGLAEKEARGQNSRLTDLRTLLIEGLGELRDIVRTADDEGCSLVEMVNLIEERVGRLKGSDGIHFEVRSEIDDEGLTVASMISRNVMRIIQESLVNIIKHSGATTVIVRITEKEGQLTVKIDDNGRGFEVSRDGKPQCHGLKNMRKRCEEIGAELTISSEPGKGTGLMMTLGL